MLLWRLCRSSHFLWLRSRMIGPATLAHVTSKIPMDSSITVVLVRDISTTVVSYVWFVFFCFFFVRRSPWGVSHHGVPGLHHRRRGLGRRYPASHAIPHLCPAKQHVMIRSWRSQEMNNLTHSYFFSTYSGVKGDFHMEIDWVGVGPVTESWSLTCF